MEKGAWRGRWGPLSSLNKLKVQIKLTCSICSWSVLSLVGAGRKPWVAGGFAADSRNCNHAGLHWTTGCVGHRCFRVILETCIWRWAQMTCDMEFI